ncbi:helix-turn-helix domain-containing protein [[Clostridium] symbiosum]|uniref:helix-turn-helix domain-containing protein n=1 Tax=Clostridium symbiosum TaxID=1512 RepID=UPI00123292CD|nr:helix-turn-helix transcriptional regulator [[Clostridium] symbiosum]KAA6136509.1 helix-turn-helix transcriptional regulator [[Clostridium] symbiosum]
MKKAETKDRIKAALEIRDMKQSELVEKTGIDKGQMSSYITGRYKPKQENLNLIAEALSVDEAWLMGYDVPMERNNYEDQNILRFDAALEEIQGIIESSGYKMLFSDDSDEVIIKTHDNDVVTCMHDYELVGKYESLQHKGIPATIESLVEDSEIQTRLNREYAFDCQLKALGWTYKILFEADPINEGHGRATALFKNKDISFKASMEDCDSFINDAESFFKERLQQLLKKSMKQMFMENSVANKPYLDADAAHSRTDIAPEKHTEELKQQEDDMMDNDDLWK